MCAGGSVVLEADSSPAEADVQPAAGGGRRLAPCPRGHVSLDILGRFTSQRGPQSLKPWPSFFLGHWRVLVGAAGRLEEGWMAGMLHSCNNSFFLCRAAT